MEKTETTQQTFGRAPSRLVRAINTENFRKERYFSTIADQFWKFQMTSVRLYASDDIR